MDNIIPVININSINIRDINIKKLEQLTTCEYKTLSAHLIGKIPPINY